MFPMSGRLILAVWDVPFDSTYTCTGMGLIVSGSSAHPEIRRVRGPSCRTISTFPKGFPLGCEVLVGWGVTELDDPSVVVVPEVDFTVMVNV